MSFGKEALPQGMTGFRSSEQTQQQHKQSFPTKRLPTFIGEYKPSDTDEDTVRIVRAAYENQMPEGDAIVTQMMAWYNYRAHYKKEVSKRTGATYNKQMTICSAGPFWRDPKKRQPCQACDLLDAQFRSGVKQKDGLWSIREHSAITILHFGQFVKQTRIDPMTNQPRLGGNGNPLWDWVKAPNEHVFYQYPDEERSECLKKHWSLGMNEKTVLLERESTIAQSCVGCRLKGGRDGRQTVGIRSELFLCASCQNDIIDVSTTEMKQSDIEKMALSPVRCPHCNHTGMMQEMIACTNPACPGAQRATMWDVDLQVKSVKPAGGGFPTLTLDHSAPYELEERFRELATPFDFAGKIFRPHTMEEQKEFYGQLLQQAPTPGGRAYGAAAGPFGPKR